MSPVTSRKSASEFLAWCGRCRCGTATAVEAAIQCVTLRARVVDAGEPRGSIGLAVTLLMTRRCSTTCVALANAHRSGLSPAW